MNSSEAKGFRPPHDRSPRAPRAPGADYNPREFHFAPGDPAAEAIGYGPEGPAVGPEATAAYLPPYLPHYPPPAAGQPTTLSADSAAYYHPQQQVRRAVPLRRIPSWPVYTLRFCQVCRLDDMELDAIF